MVQSSNNLLQLYLVKSLVAIISCCIHSHRKAPFPFWSPHSLMASISWLTVCPALPRRVGGQIKKKAGRAVPCSCSQAPAICLTNGLGRIQPINEIKKQCITVQNKHLICYMMQFQVATALFSATHDFRILVFLHLSLPSWSGNPQLGNQRWKRLISCFLQNAMALYIFVDYHAPSRPAEGASLRKSSKTTSRLAQHHLLPTGHPTAKYFRMGWLDDFPVSLGIQ